MRTHIRPLAAILIFSFLISILLLSLPLAGVAGTVSLRRFSGSAYFDSGYSVYAVAEETSPGLFDVRISPQLSPDYTTNDDIVSYQLQVDGGAPISIPLEGQEYIPIANPGASLSLVPVYDEGGPFPEEALHLTPSTTQWDAVIGTMAAVENPDSLFRLNLRYAPSEDAEVWMQYYNGAPLLITNNLPDGWVAVTIGDEEPARACGYMKGEYIAFGNDAAQVQPAMPIHHAAVIFTLFTAPDEASPALFTGEKGTDVTILGLSKDWWHVEADGVLGYVKIDSIDLSRPGKFSSQGTPQQDITQAVQQYILHGQNDTPEAGKIKWSKAFLDQVDLPAMYQAFLSSGGATGDVHLFALYITENAPIPENWQALITTDLYALYGATAVRFESLGDDLYQVYIVVDGVEIPYVVASARTGYFHG